MKYSYEYKRMCVDLYRRGQWPETPTCAKGKKFRDMIREWGAWKMRVVQKDYIGGAEQGVDTGSKI